MSVTIIEMQVKITLRNYFSPLHWQKFKCVTNILLVSLWGKCYNPHWGQIDTITITNMFSFWTYCLNALAQVRNYMIINCNTVIAKEWTQPNCSCIGDWLNKLFPIHTMEYYAVAKLEWRCSSICTDIGGNL